jgi:hypothetical protein
MAILGLLVEQSDTAAGVRVRLNEVFPRAKWPRNVVRDNMPSLLKQGFLRLVAKGSEPALDRYEATEQGMARFHAWVSQSTTLPPVLRNRLQARLRFAERDELASLIGTVRDSEAACSQECAAAHSRLKTANRLARRSKDAQSDWRLQLRLILMGDDAMLRGMMARRLQRLGDELEDLLDEESAWTASQEARDG